MYHSHTGSLFTFSLLQHIVTSNHFSKTSPEQATLNYVHTMTVWGWQILLKNINWIVLFPSFDPATHLTQRNSDLYSYLTQIGEFTFVYTPIYNDLCP